ncbi:MAG: tRNA preQ1(34) S-adenosylmethionine ribosyltransferase-isomerase QueA [Syntrophomonadaceae bacterium]|nr:tRNA preQ1(34) S-adenosylmethionine ribosyltransferase-isomerase QueA [Syntrophomonadaceae bacterium]
MDPFRLETYDYHLPAHAVARYPAEPRDSARLLVLDRASGTCSDRRFSDLPEYVGRGDVLVVNETMVIPARLYGRLETGGRVEVLLLREAGDAWQALVRPARRLRPGKIVHFPGGVSATVEAELDFPGGRRLRFHTGGKDFAAWLGEAGTVPLPPYIDRPAEPDDRWRYQTVYAARPGSVAAPTAGLHFTPGLLQRLQAGGVEVVPLVLHVGLGTFRPVEVADIRQHRMHREYYQVDEPQAHRLNRARREGRRILAVGTTVVRALESAYREGRGFAAGSGETDCFIYPGYRFRAVDGLVTNFHLPRSSLLMLVCAFAGIENTMAAYRHALAAGYRFFSYGDAMFIHGETSHVRL